MEQIAMQYGDEQLMLDFAGAASVTRLEGTPPKDIENLQQALILGLEEEMVASPPLHKLVSAQDKITIIISDLTRLWMRQDLLCGFLVDYLVDVLVVPAQNIVVLVALGTHRPLQKEELQRVAGTAYNRVEVVNHNSTAKTVYLGTTSFGTKVKVNPLAVDRKVILIGGTVHHLMSGYGGGRKSILPGVAAKSTIVQNHLRCLDNTRPHSSHLIGTGKLANNPVHLDMVEAAALVNPIFGIQVIAGSKGPSCIICGDWHQSWMESCTMANKYFGVKIEHKADVVVASCGGYPKDINLYQAVKSLLNAGQALKENGELVLLARCEEGGGAPDFFDWAKPLREGRLDAALREDFSIAGYIFYASIETIRRCKKVLLLTDISKKEVDGMGMDVYANINELQKHLDIAGKSVYVMPMGGNTVPY